MVMNVATHGTFTRAALSAIALLAAVVTTCVAIEVVDAQTTMHGLTPQQMTWGDGPPSLPPGAKVAVLQGDPTKPGPFTIRARMPAGYKIPAHWHPTDENITVISGLFNMGMG